LQIIIQQSNGDSLRQTIGVRAGSRAGEQQGTAHRHQHPYPPPDLDDTEAEKINEIKEFLTLSAQNTISFYNRTQSRAVTEQAIKMEKAERQAKNITDFKVVRGLGKGAFGQVFMVKDTQESIAPPIQTSSTR
jgi:hypothetical protein